MNEKIDHLNSFIVDTDNYSVTYNGNHLNYLPYPDKKGLVEISPRCGKYKAVKVPYQDLIDLVRVRPCGDMLDWEHEESFMERLDRLVEKYKNELSEIL